jgi:hypothetical protein
VLSDVKKLAYIGLVLGVFVPAMGAALFCDALGVGGSVGLTVILGAVMALLLEGVEYV